MPQRVDYQRQVTTDHYSFTAYVTKARWTSIWYQLDEVLASHPRSVLEVGVGPGILGMILDRAGVVYESVDIDPELHPTLNASVTDLPYADGTFDVVACFQVLEHIRYGDFVSALKELARVSCGRVIVSLPDARRRWHYSVHVPMIGDVRFHIPRPQLIGKRHEFNGEHYWEVNKRGYSLRRISSDIRAAGLSIESTYRPAETLWVRFFRLSRS